MTTTVLVDSGTDVVLEVDEDFSDDVVEDDSEVLVGSSEEVEEGVEVVRGVVLVVRGVVDVKIVDEGSAEVVVSTLTMLLVGVASASVAVADVTAAPVALASSWSSSPPACLSMISKLALPIASASIMNVWATLRKESATMSSWNNRVEYMMTVW